MARFPSLIALAVLTGCSTTSDTPGGDDDACPEVGPNSALAFDGVDDYATTGVKPELGLATFTLEAWIRRDGEGMTFTTGVGGLRLTPIATKGLGEGDGSNIDCNYALGFWGDVLGADFEDAATGANHPVTGATAIPRGEWHHVAATYDGTAWRLYVDGKLDGEAAANATPRADSVHPFAIASAVGSDGVPHGFLHGALDEVRVWDRARTAEELADGMYRTIAQGDGLVGRWALDAEDPAIMVVGATQLDAGATLDQGSPPVIASESPADGAMTGPDVALEVGLEMATAARVTTTYHLRELSAADDFTIVVLPDTQIYTIEGRGLEHFFHDQTKWIREHREELNIIGVIHNGDLINNEPLLYQWRVADAAMKRLETAEADRPEGVPYGIAIGNHDNKLVGDNKVLNTDKFNQYFGVARFAGRSYYGGHHGTKNDNSWFTFSSGGLDFVVVNLMYDLDPDPAVVAWARSIFEMHPDAFGILNTHYLLTSGGNFGPQAKGIYNALRDVPNVQLMTGGHIANENRRVDTFQGHTIHSMLADYQGRAQGGAGHMRIWEFSPANGTVTVRTYSPTLDKYETDADSEFTLEVDLRGAGGPFQEFTAGSLAPGKTYEWYADVATCGQQVKSPVYRFTTLASARAARELNDSIKQPPRRKRTKQITNGPVHVRPDDPALAD